VLFTLSPEAEGRRKPLGLGRPERATAVYAALLRHLESFCSRIPGVDLLLTTPEKQVTGVPGRHLLQRGESFGESLRLAVEDAFSMGYQQVVVIGNDAPEISRDYLQKAFALLEAADSKQAVLGPASDGGYALLGLNRPCAAAFESIPWGTGRVARLTQERLLGAGFTVEGLPALEDIDNRHGLARFLARARSGFLAELAREVATLLSATINRSTEHTKSLPEILFLGWRSLRAPPALIP
jgi:hypothetical protein